MVVWGHFSDAQPRVVHWRDGLTRPGFFFWELCPELNIRPRGRMATDAFFKHIKSLKPKSKNSDNGQINI